MKKSYQKPALYAETFELVEHIAGPCNGLEGDTNDSFRVTQRNSTDCEFSSSEDWDVIMFTEAPRCNDLMPKDYQYTPAQCYNSMIGTYNIFAS